MSHDRTVKTLLFAKYKKMFPKIVTYEAQARIINLN